MLGIAYQGLRRPCSGLSTEYSPRLRQPPVIVDRDCAFLEEAPEDPLGVSASIEAGSTRVSDCVVFFDSKWIVLL